MATLITQKVAKIMDSKYKLIKNNNNETSVFLSLDNVKKLCLDKSETLLFSVYKKDFVEALGVIIALSNLPLYIKDIGKIETTDIRNKLEEIEKFFGDDEIKQYAVEFHMGTSKDNRNYLLGFGKNGLSIRHFFIQDHTILYFEEKDNTNYLRFTNRIENLENTSEDDIRALIEETPFHHNRLVFGAPGTGKSHKLEEQRKPTFGEGTYERVTFHPNYSYAQFVGCYKPVSHMSRKTGNENEQKVIDCLNDDGLTAQEKYDALYEIFKDDRDLTRLPFLLGICTDESFKTRKKDGQPTQNDNGVEVNHGKAIRPYVSIISNKPREISYEYVPGPFMRLYVKAKKNPKKNFLLIIEEINRANVAAVFGDVFQLLDRKENGKSEYSIAVSEDMKRYLESEEIFEDTMSIPDNMYIWATMNSADQGVFPMDAAFKRRWNFEYIGIDDNVTEEVKKRTLYFGNEEDKEKHTIKWNELREEINRSLKKNVNWINEDKLLGPHFISKNVTSAEFCSKVLMYLYEDVVKIQPDALFNKAKIETDGEQIFYSDIVKAWNLNGAAIFKDVYLKEQDNLNKDDNPEKGK